MHPSTDPIVILLAAGKGERLRPLTEKLPKPLIRVQNDETLIERVIDAFAQQGLRYFLVIGGHHYEILTEALNELFDKKYENYNLSYIKNPEYETKNNAYGVYHALKYIAGERDIYVANTNIYFDKSIVPLLTTQSDSAILMNEHSNLTVESMKVRCERIYVKEIGRKFDRLLSHGEYLGLTKIAAKDLKLFRVALNATVQIDPINFQYEDALQLMCHWTQVRGIFTHGSPWTQIDTQEDYQKAKLMTRMDTPYE